MELDPLTAISPLDGRYRHVLGPIAGLTSEYGLFALRVQIEIEWFIHLAAAPEIVDLPPLDPAAAADLRSVYQGFGRADAARIKEIERTTNHDVKATEYFVKEVVRARPALARFAEFVHFGCTSEDINNLAQALTLREVRERSLLPTMDELVGAIHVLAERHADDSMLSRTHGQAATPTTMGKELANFVHRLRRQRTQLAAVPVLGKLNGAVGNYNALRVAYPTVDWPTLTQRFIARLGLEQNAFTTQIEPHDWMAEYFHALCRFNQVLLGFDRDVWGYIALDYFRSRKVEGEVGSSTMPHKVNPIDFENSEGNLGVANALLQHLADKLTVSRWQRDLSDSTVLRNLGVAAGHCLVAYASASRGIAKLELNPSVLRADLERSWEVLGEAVQTVMRRHGLDEPYERLKAATRGERLDGAAYARLLDSLPLPAEARAELARLRPETYTGFAAELARSLDPSRGSKRS